MIGGEHDPTEVSSATGGGTGAKQRPTALQRPNMDFVLPKRAQQRLDQLMQRKSDLQRLNWSFPKGNLPTASAAKVND